MNIWTLHSAQILPELIVSKSFPLSRELSLLLTLEMTFSVAENRQQCFQAFKRKRGRGNKTPWQELETIPRSHAAVCERMTRRSLRQAASPSQSPTPTPPSAPSLPCPLLAPRSTKAGQIPSKCFGFSSFPFTKENAFLFVLRHTEERHAITENESSSKFGRAKKEEKKRGKKKKKGVCGGGGGEGGGNKRGKNTKRDNENKIKTLMRKKGHVPNGEGTEKAVTAAKEDETVR